MEPRIYKPGAYKSPGIYKGTGGIYNGRGVYNDGSAGGGGDIPFLGEKTNEWNFSKSNDNLYVDIINGVVAEQWRPNGFGPNDFLDVGYNHGVDLNVLIEAKDYIELEFILQTTSNSGHIRLINGTINDDSAFVAWRNGYYYWTSYFSSNGWGAALSNDYNLFSGKKIGIYVKDSSFYDVYIDNELAFENIRHYPVQSNLEWNAGCSTDWYTENNVIECKGATIYKNCVPK